MNRHIVLLWLFVLTVFLTIITVSQQFILGGFVPGTMGIGVWTRTGPPNIKSSTGAYSLINDQSILASGNTVWAGSNGDGVYMSTDGGQTWINYSNGLPRDNQGRVDMDAEHLDGSFSSARAPRLYITTIFATDLYRSDDGGLNWKKVYRSGIPSIDSTITSLFVASVPLAGPVEFPDKLWVSVFGNRSGIYYSVNSGEGWAPFDPAGLPSTECQFVSGKEGAPTGDPDLVFAACRSNTAGVGSVYSSMANSPHWVSINHGLPANLDVSVITPSNKDGTRRIYLGLSNHSSNGPIRIYRSDNNGVSWVEAAEGLPSNALVMDIAVDARNSKVAYAALWAHGVYKTTDAGEHWVLLNNGLTTSTASGITVGVSYAPGPPAVHLGTRGGVWSISDTNTGNCSVTLSETVRPVPSWDETYSVNIRATPRCSWSAVSDSRWIKLGTTTSGTGSATITFRVEQNPNTTPRNGTISIGGQTLTITQSGSSICEYYIPFPTKNVSSAGASGSGSQFYLRTTSSNCPWAASSTVPSWITVNPPGTGSGSSYINYTVKPNNELSPRTGTITVGGRSFTITQPDAGSDPCRQRMPIDVGQTLNGSLSTTDCQVDSYRDYYSFRGRAGQRIAVEITAPSFFPDLDVRLVGTNTPPQASPPNEHFLRHPYYVPYPAYRTLFVTGDYIIEVNSKYLGVGDYTINLIDADSVCPPVPINPGTHSASLASSDCGNAFGDYSDIFTFYGTQGQKITISAGSPTMDLWLVLYNDAGEVAFDNNGGGGTTARIPAGTGQFTLPATGLYRIEVKTRDTTPKTGNYTLTFATTSNTRVKKGKRK